MKLDRIVELVVVLFVTGVLLAVNTYGIAETAILALAIANIVPLTIGIAAGLVMAAVLLWSAATSRTLRIFRILLISAVSAISLANYALGVEPGYPMFFAILYTELVVVSIGLVFKKE